MLANPWVENVTRVSAPYKRANRLFHPEDTVVDINGVRVGGNAPIAVMAGPCSIEGEEHTIKMAKAVKAGGANFLRGGAYKPRTSPTPSRVWAPRASWIWSRPARSPACLSSVS